MSSYNKECIVNTCEICDLAISHELEVHHIQQQSEADTNGFLKDNTHKNNLRNLVVVCKTCHDKHHAGKIEIGKVKQTSDGLIRQIVKSKETKDEKDENKIKIVEYFKKYPTMPIKRIAFELETNENIIVTEQYLRTIRKTG